MRNGLKVDKFTLGMIILLFLWLITTGSPVLAANPSYQPSLWAAEKISMAETIKLLPQSFSEQPFTAAITRMEFSILLLNACHVFELDLPDLAESHPYVDCQNTAVEQASQLGLIQGTGDGYFHPDQPLSREMAATILAKLGRLINDQDAAISSTEAEKILRDYVKDGNQVSGWARTSFARMYAQGILSGGGDGCLNPQGKISREQAVTIVLNLIAYCDQSSLREAGVTACVLPAPSGMMISPVYQSGQVNLAWNKISAAAAYEITLFKDGIPVYSTRSSENSLDFKDEQNRDGHGSRTAIFSAGENQTAHLVLEVAAVNRLGEASVFSLRREFAVRPVIAARRTTYSSRSVDSYGSASEAAANMVKVQVRVWRLASNGSKTTANTTLTVHQDVAGDVKNIFAEIYTGSEKFPIKICSGYAYRSGTSQHSNGTAIDINPTENYFLGADGGIKAGGFWKPDTNPYSIRPNGDVVQAFNHYGWHWSPDMNWSNGADYMHFSLKGL